MPVTSPIAHTPSAARQRASTSIPADCRLDADRLEPDARRARPPAGRDDELRAACLAAVVELDDPLVAVDTDGDGATTEHEPDSIPLEELAEKRTDPRILAIGEARRPLHDRHRASRSAQGTAPSSTATTPPPMKTTLSGISVRAVTSRFVQWPGLGEPRNRRDDCVGAGRDDDRIPLERVPVDLHAPGPRDRARRLDHRHARASRSSRRAANRRGRRPCSRGTRTARPVECRGRDAGGPRGLGAELRRPQQRLRGNAAPVRALAADQLRLDERDPAPGPEQRVEDDLARGAGSENNRVESVAHLHPPFASAALLTPKSGVRYGFEVSTLDGTDEVVLVQALRAGDEAAFSALVRRYHAPMVRVALSLVSSTSVAEEVVQEAWVGVLRGLASFEGRASLKTWIFRILTNTAKTRAVREHRTVPFSSLAGAADDEPLVDPSRFLGADDRWADHWATPPKRWETLPEASLMSGELPERLDQAIAALPPMQQQVITLRDIDGWSSEEVCNTLELSETNQRVLLHRARSKVRSLLER